MSVRRSFTPKLAGVVALVAGLSFPAAGQDQPADAAAHPVLAGEFVTIAQRRASGVAAPLPLDAQALPGAASFGATLTWIDGTTCAEWQAVELAQAPVDIDDPILSDVTLGPNDGPHSQGDRRLMTPMRLQCGERHIASLLIIDRRVFVVASADGATYTLLEKPLSERQAQRLQAQLKDMKFYHGEASGRFDEATRTAAAAYAEYRGAAYRFQPVAITENLVDALRVLRGSRCCAVERQEPTAAGPAPTIATSVEIASLGEAQARLGFRLLEALAAEPGSPAKLAVSPASVAAVLAFLQLGADADMQAALAKTLALDAEAGFENLRRAARVLSAAPDDAPLKFANALFADPAFAIYPAAQAKLAVAGMEALTAELTQPAGLALVNGWVKDNTGGLIENILDVPLPDPGIVALNALHFKDRWRLPFDPARPGAFRLAGGAPVETPMMSLLEAEIACREEGRFTAAVLPYVTEGLSFVVVSTNDEPAGLAEFAPVAGWLKGAMPLSEGDLSRDCLLRMPKFSIEAQNELLPALKGLGLAGGFSPSAFKGFSAHPLEISRIVQRVVISVDETGTEAGAVTATVGVTGMMRPPPLMVEADKPFLFALVDETNGLVLVSGYVGDPTTN